MGEVIRFPSRAKPRDIPIVEVTTGEYISMHNADQWRERQPPQWLEEEMRKVLERVRTKPGDSE